VAPGELPACRSVCTQAPLPLPRRKRPEQLLRCCRLVCATRIKRRKLLAAQGRRAVPLIQGWAEVSNPSEPAPVVPSPDPWSAMRWARIPWRSLRQFAASGGRAQTAGPAGLVVSYSLYPVAASDKDRVGRLSCASERSVLRSKFAVADNEPNEQVPCSALELSSRWLVAADALYSLDGSKLLGYAASGALCSFDGTTRLKGSTAATSG